MTRGVITARKAPVAVALCISVPWVLLSAVRPLGPWGLLVGPPYVTIGAAIAMSVIAYWTAALSSARWAVLGGVALLAAAGSPAWWVSPSWGFALQYAGLFVGAPWVAGRVARAHRSRAAASAVIAAELAREGDTRGRLALAAERVRLAREVDDATGHAVTRMVIQAAAAEQVLDTQPDHAREALQAVQAVGRAAIADLRDTLRTLRSPAQAAQASASFDEELVLPKATRRVRWPQHLDLMLALVAFAVGVAGVVDWGNPEERLAVLALLPFLTLPVAGRRRHPVLALWTICAAAAVGVLVVGVVPLLVVVGYVIVLTAFALGAWHFAPRPVLLAAGAPLMLAVLVQRRYVLDVLFLWTIYFVAPVLFGRAVGRYRRESERLRLLVGELERARDERARLAVLEERTRVARELHDSVAHGVSLMVLQAGAAEQVLGSDPAACRQAAQAVQAAGREAVGELAHLLAVLDPDAETALSHAPWPSLSRLDALVADMQQAGLPVMLRVEGAPGRPLPSSLDISAYRIVQEALTNVVKHAGLVPTSVAVRYAPDRLVVEVHNDASADGHRSSTLGSGQGLPGMHERATLHGGELRTGQDAAGGYRVRAALPLDPLRG